MVERKPLNRKVLFVGLDGASLQLVKPLVEQGRLPNLARVIENGAFFRARTDEPVISPCVWTSIATGKRPEKHNVKSFFATSSSVTAKRIWNIFQDFGMSVGVMGYFISWPPEPVSGFMIPDLLALDDQTHPPEYGFLYQLTADMKKGKAMSPFSLAKLSFKAMRYGVKPATMTQAMLTFIKKKFFSSEVGDDFFATRVLKQRLFKDVFLAAYKKYQPEFAYFHNHIIDSCSHNFWRYLEPDKFSDVPADAIQKHHDKIPLAYEEADRTLGEILKLTDQQTLLIVASDHGFKAAENPDVQWRQPDINSEKLMKTLGIEQEISYSNVGYDIIVKPRVESQEAREALKKLFNSIIVVEENLPLFRILEYDDTNLWLRLNNSLKKIEGNSIRLPAGNWPITEFVRATDSRSSGVHDGENGIFILSGYGVKRNVQLTEQAVEVFDYLPTILALMNMPVARDMDGRALTEAIEERFLEQYPISYIESYETEEKKRTADQEANEILKAQLRALGYL